VMDDQAKAGAPGHRGASVPPKKRVGVST
jgi:hypothetical protein